MVLRINTYGDKNDRQKDDYIASLKDEIKYLQKLLDRSDAKIENVRNVARSVEHILNTHDIDDDGTYLKILVAVEKKIRTIVGYSDADNI